MKRHALLIGDNDSAPWHPLRPVERLIVETLQDDFRVTVSEDYERMAALSAEPYALFISYTDCWRRRLTPEQTAGVLRFVAGGGGLLAVHNGISLQVNHELLRMIGGKFTGHPPRQMLRYAAAADAADHPLLAGVGTFELDEEPYQFEFDPFAPRNVFLEFEYDGKRWPAGWEADFGLGKIVYLQPGHHPPSFASPAFRRLLRNAARWAARRTD